MKVGWLLDPSVFPKEHEELAAAIVRQGHETKSVARPDLPYTWADTKFAYRKLFPKGACVVTHGDIDLVNRVRADALWTPGVFATVEHFFCSHYYAHFGRFLLNQNYAMLPFAELLRRADWLFAAFGRDGRIFVRPDSPLKLFTGLLASQANFERDVGFMGFYELRRSNGFNSGVFGVRQPIRAMSSATICIATMKATQAGQPPMAQNAPGSTPAVAPPR